MEVRVDNRGYCEAAWEHLSSRRDALFILRVAGTVEVLGGVRTRGLEDGAVPHEMLAFQSELQFRLKYRDLHLRTGPLSHWLVLTHHFW